MKEELVNMWGRRSSGYNRFVRQGLSKKFEKEGWQSIFTEAIGREKRKILDVGTGPGVVAIQLAELGHDVTAVDLADGMLKAAKENAELYGLNIRFEKGDAENLPFEDNAFDVVVSKYVLWTLPDPEKALREWKRVVKPGGRVVYVDGNWYSDLKNSWWRRRWAGFAKFIVTVTEFRNMYKRGNDVKSDIREKLWSTNAVRPAADVKMMQGLGFENVQTRRGLKNRVLSGMRLIKLGYYRDYFLVSGTKDVQSGVIE